MPEPIAVELHNTIRMSGGVPRDVLSHAWLEALDERLPTAGPGAWPDHGDLVALRDAIRSALQAKALGQPPHAATLDAINRASAGAPRSPRVDADLTVGADYHGASRAAIVLAAFAWDAIELLTGPLALRVCGAPGCILLFVKDHPRREWCSNACGNRARQARHYERSRRERDGRSS
jgi:predicted RNA-binding Zn ribbon-like protein